MYPRYKLFDITLSIALIAAFACLIRNATPELSSQPGLWWGLLPSLGATTECTASPPASASSRIWQGAKMSSPLPGLTAWAAGLVIGYLPVLAMIAFAPGFANALWESIVLLFDLKATNLPLQVPWPWLAPIDADFPIATAQKLLIGTFFIALLAFGIAGIAFVIRRAPRTSRQPLNW